MKGAQSTTAPTRLTVVGASGTIGAEVARLGVAYGAEVVGITRSGRPDTDEPWVHGVTWVTRDFAAADALVGQGGGALVVAASVPVPAGAADMFDRIVVVAPAHTVVPATHGVVVARPVVVDATPLDPDRLEVALAEDVIRVETLAMALLRAALDEGISAVLEHEDLAYLGDAVMLQG